MVDAHPYPAGVPCCVDIEQPDPDRAAEFYAELFGWRFENRVPAGAPGRYLVGSLDGRDVAAVTGGDPSRPPAWRTYVAVDDADATAAAAAQAGGTVVEAPHDLPGTGRTAALTDPSGAAIRLWQAGGWHGAERVNAPGSWNWSDLHTADVQGAIAFYQEVFGWHAAAVDLGFGGSWMWQRPGYGDIQAERDPDLRRRHADPSVPAGFSDAIGWLLPSDDPPSWRVTFAVADAFATVERAERLGAKVLTPAYAAGPVELAVLADPQGAEFTVSRYLPKG